MFKGINIGQYLKRDSVIHKADARIKLLVTFVYIITIIFLENFAQYAFATVSLMVYIAFSKIEFTAVLKSLKPIIILVLFTTIFNLFATPGQPIFKLGMLSITYEGAVFTARLMVRLFLLIICSSMLTYTTTPNQMTAGLENIFGFLKKFKVPVNEFAMMTTIAIRFIPTLIEEADKIIKAQLSRGAAFEKGNILKKVKAYIPIIIPLIVNAVSRASDLATAMEVRCYNSSKNRTKLHNLCYTNKDFTILVILLIYVLIIILLKKF